MEFILEARVVVYIKATLNGESQEEVETKFEKEVNKLTVPCDPLPYIASTEITTREPPIFKLTV